MADQDVMGTPSVSPPRREAGQHAQEMAERAARGAAGERKVGAILEDLGPDRHQIAERLRLALEVDAAPTRGQGA